MVKFDFKRPRGANARKRESALNKFYTENIMAQAKKRGIIDRLMLGKEKSEGYARASLPSNRWELFWDIFKGRFGKLVIVNLLTLLFFIPLILVLFFRYVAIINYGTIYPFAQGFGVGYMSVPSLGGYAENIIFNVNLLVYLFLPIAVTIAAVGISGGAYVIRNMVWTEGIFVANDFWFVRISAQYSQ